MSEVRDLVNTLKVHLAPFGYSECAHSRIGGTDLAAVLAAPKRPRKLLCAIVDLPEGLTDARAAARFVNALRRGLAKQFASFPWPNRLGTYVILLGDHATFESLFPQQAGLTDFPGLQVNSVLGTVLVDAEALRSRADERWDAPDGCEHFEHIQTAVAQWCRRCRRQGAKFRTNKWSLSVS